MDQTQGAEAPTHEATTCRDSHREPYDIFVTVGTDHHPFDRVIQQVDEYVRHRALEGPPVRAFFQTGTSASPSNAESADYVKPDEMAWLMATSSVVVCHGGPATIVDARNTGRMPIVVPRDPGLGEHVDSHQQRFARFLSERGQIALCTDQQLLWEAIDRKLADSAPNELEQTETVTGEAVDRLTALVDRAVYLGERPGRRALPARFRRRRRDDADADQYRILFATSGGGHLAQCLKLRPWFERHERSWVTFDMLSVRSLLGDEQAHWAHFPTTRHIGNLLRNLVLANRLLRRERPDVIVSTGAGVAVPFFWLSRCYGVVTVFIEVYDRIDLATMTGKLVQPTADLMVVQWPEQQELYKRAIVVGTLL